jgi:hypothetical protein
MRRLSVGERRALQSKSALFDTRTHLYVKDFMPEEQEIPEWPTHFPNDCPDSQATPFDGPIFCFVCGDPNVDYKTMWEQRRAENAQCCARAALSCYTSFNDIDQTRDIMQGRWGDHKIAKADLSAEHGKIKHTPSRRYARHHSAWLRARYSYEKLFQVIE